MCYGAVHGKHEKGTVEYETALAEERKKVSEWESLPADQKHPAKMKKTLSAAHPKQQDIVVILEARRHELMEEVIKINNTLEMIRKYEKAA
jgi:hypothetical protein